MDTHVYHSLEEFFILDRIEQQILIGDWKKGQRKWLWVNKAWCDSNRTTLEFWQNMDMNTAQSEAMEQFQDEIYAKVQVQKEEVTKIKTVYHQGQARTLLQTFRPIQVKLPEWDDVRILFTNEVKSPDGKESGEQNKLALATELLAHSDTITMMFDAQKEELEYCNQKATTTFELAKRQDGGRLNRLKHLEDVFSCILWENKAQKRKVIQGVRAFKLNSPRIMVECQMHFSGMDEEEIWMQIHFISGMNPVSGKASVIVNLTDISTLHKQSMQILEASKMQEQFSAAVSHELRTPLNGIIGLSESLISNPKCDEQMRKTLRLVKSSGMRLSALVNDILDAASAKRGAFVIKREMVLLNEVADNVCDMLQTTMMRKTVRLVNLIGCSSEFGENAIPHIEGDSGRINQILTNLLSNSIKFTEKGTITLSARLLSPNEVVIEVADTGCGIPKKKWDQVWGAFKQVDMSTTRKYGGTGLGLSLVKELVEAHNGRVGMVSVCEGAKTGSTFFCVLPVKQPADSRGLGSKTARSGLLRARDLKAGVITKVWEEFDRRQHEVGSDASSAAMHQPCAAPCSPLPATRSGSVTPTGSSEAGDEDSMRRAWGEAGARGKLPTLGSSGSEVSRSSATRRQSEEGAAAVGKVKHHSELHGTLEILSVDDNHVNHCVVENSVSPRGYVVTTCMSGIEALDLLDTRGYLPDLILLDCMMPGMSGYEMCSKLREKYPCNTLPVIMVSAKSNEEDVVRGLAVGCNDYIAKPYGPNELNARIDVQLRLKELWLMELGRQLSERGAILHPPEEMERLSARSTPGEMTKHAECTVLVCDIVDLLFYARTLAAPDMARLVDSLYDGFDEIATAEALTRIVDDSYMLVLEDAELSAEAQAVKMMAVAERMLRVAHATSTSINGAAESPRVRIGIARGSAYSGVVGMKMTSFLYFGRAVQDAVHVAVRAAPGCVAVAEEVKGQLRDAQAYLVPYAKMRSRREGWLGSQMYLVKVGEYKEGIQQLAAGAADGQGEEEYEKESDYEVVADSALNRLKVFLRLNSGVDMEEDQTLEQATGTAEGGGVVSCGACSELRTRCLRLEALVRQTPPLGAQRSEGAAASREEAEGASARGEEELRRELDAAKSDVQRLQAQVRAAEEAGEQEAARLREDVKELQGERARLAGELRRSDDKQEEARRREEEQRSESSCQLTHARQDGGLGGGEQQQSSRQLPCRTNRESAAGGSAAGGSAAGGSSDGSEAARSKEADAAAEQTSGSEQSASGVPDDASNQSEGGCGCKGTRRLQKENGKLLTLCTNLSEQLRVMTTMLPRAAPQPPPTPLRSPPLRSPATLPAVSRLGVEPMPTPCSGAADAKDPALASLFRELQQHAWARLSQDLHQMQANSVDGFGGGFDWWSASGRAMPLKNQSDPAEDDFLSPPRSALASARPAARSPAEPEESVGSGSGSGAS